MIRLRTLAIGLAATAMLALAAACGDGPDSTTTPTVAATATASAGSSAVAGIPDDFGPAPKFGGNITAVAPAHAQKVAKAKLVTPADRIGGICFDGNFEGFDKGNLQWFRMAIDDDEVTEDLTWFVKADQLSGTACYKPKDGLAVGKHTAAVTVQNPSVPTEPTRQVVSWAFEVE